MHTRISKILETEDIEFVAELKYDGASISILFENGKLSQAVTRVDGFKAMKSLPNAKTIKDIPLQLQGNFPERFFTRGEIYLTHNNFNKINEERLAEGYDAFMNPRNTVSGSLKPQDSGKVEKEKSFGGTLSISRVQNSPAFFENAFRTASTGKTEGFKISENAKLCKNTRSTRFHQFLERETQEIEFRH